jgi:Flp pilus assembly protein TadB
MAQTRRRRQTKHRGNAAGMVEARGRTGRKPTADERKPTARDQATRRRPNRYDQPPTWKSAFTRSLIALVFFAVLVLLVLKPENKLVALIWIPLLLVIYVPMGYYTDLWLYRRRQRQKAKAAGK